MAVPDSTTATHEPARRKVHVVPHTHWDREWYSPFQTFRLRLVDLVDGLLDLMESDPSYARFLLDGQMAAVDDYLEVRPENEARLRALAASGRLACGPWYILMDEFLVSAETIVRNLQLGLERAAAFSGAMEIGYLPDMFGHVAQMPQILSGAGFCHAVVWRGVPSAVDRTGFWWESPDGSTVRAEYLVSGYSAGAAVADDAKALVRRLDALEAERLPFLPDATWPILFPNGTDHQQPQPWLGSVVEEANEVQDHFEIVISSYPEALEDAPTTGLATWQGEMRSGARSNVLMGVASNRVDVKQAAARAERALERVAEPLASVFLPSDRYPDALLRIAWRELIRNSAHDSICACSHDEVDAAVIHRYAEATRIAEGVTEGALRHLAESVRDPGHVVVNPSARTRSGMVEMVVSGDGPLAGTQVLSERAGLATELVLSVPEVRAILGQLGVTDELGDGAYVTGVDVEEVDSGFEVAVAMGPFRREGFPIEQVRDDLLSRLDHRPDAEVKVSLDQVSSRRVLARIGDVPGLGWRAYVPAPLEAEVTAEATEVGGAVLSTTAVRVEISPLDGSFALGELAGLNRLVDEGDHGDTYNYSPPANDISVADPETVEIRIVESGPVRAVAEVVRTYRWPERVDDATRSRVGEEVVAVTSRIELRAGESLVRVETSFDNSCRDHRLRAVFPLPEPATSSSAECAFAVVERGLEAEGGPSERPLATFPSRRFVKAGGLTLCHEGLCEYELIDIAGGEAHAVALTLLRATGMLSRFTMTNRPLPAGPTDPLEGPQLQGRVRVRYALAIGDVDGYAAADDAFTPMPVVASLGGGSRPSAGSALTVTGAEVSAVHRVAGGALEVRVFNPTGAAREVTVTDGAGAATRTDDEERVAGPRAAHGSLVDLRGRYVAAFEGSFVLGPHKIATIRVDGL